MPTKEGKLVTDDAFILKMQKNVNKRLRDKEWHRVPLMGDARVKKTLIAYVALGYIDDAPSAWFAAPAVTQMTGEHMVREMNRLMLPQEHCQQVDWAQMSGGQAVGMPTQETTESTVMELARELAEDGPLAVFALLQSNPSGARSFEFWHPPHVNTEVLWGVLQTAAKRAFG
jgi:hypothetical protein